MVVKEPAMHDAHGNLLLSTARPRAGFLVAPAALLLLSGCQTAAPPAAAPPAVAVEPGAPAPGSKRYAVQAGESLLQVFVYRGGTMARMGHNHVIASHHLAGSVFATDDPLETRFDVSFPVAELTVDEAALRANAGADFAASVPQSARDGTRRNLLSPALLDAAAYPTIRLRAVDVKPAGAGFDVGVQLTVKDQLRVVRVPVTVTRMPGRMVARGEFPLRQSDLGLAPFSVMMGALVVVDEMRVQFELHAHESAGS
jgi:polyisoprenoid-binding protein YceI